MNFMNISFYLSGNLQVIYPELAIDECSEIPKDLREKISTVWDAPQILFTDANEVSLRFSSLSAISNKFQSSHCGK